MGICRQDWTGSGCVPVAGSCEHDTEPSDSVRGGRQLASQEGLCSVQLVAKYGSAALHVTMCQQLQEESPSRRYEHASTSLIITQRSRLPWQNHKIVTQDVFRRSSVTSSWTGWWQVVGLFDEAITWLQSMVTEYKPWANSEASDGNEMCGPSIWYRTIRLPRSDSNNITQLD
jgi:hypothetical protein